MQRFIDAIAETVTRRRGAALALIGVITVATGMWLPDLETDPRPQELTVDIGEARACEIGDHLLGFGEVRDRFG